MTAKRKKAAVKKPSGARVRRSAAPLSWDVPLVLITNPRPSAEIGVTTVVPEQSGDDLVVEVFGIAVGGTLEAVRASVLERDQPIPQVPPREGYVEAHLSPAEITGDGPVETLWSFQRANRRRRDNRLKVRPGLNNRLLILAKFAENDRWVLADLILELLPVEQYLFSGIAPRKFNVTDPVPNQEVTGDVIGSGLTVEVKIDSNVGSKLLTGARAKILTSASSSPWTTKNFPRTDRYSLSVLGASSGKNTLIVEGEFEGYKDNWVTTTSVVFIVK
jgi:hypothetical protein